MTTRQAREGLVSRLTPAMREHGFQYVKSRDRFEHAEAGYLHTLTLVLIDIGRGAELRHFVALRADRVETILCRAAGDTSPAARHGVTLTRELEPLLGNPGTWRIQVRTEADFDPAAARTLAAVSGPAASFYAKYSDLAAIDEHLNSQPDQPAALSRSHLHRAQAGMVVARLVGRTNIPELIEGYHRFLSRIHEPDVAVFDKFVASLDAIAA